jgi:hypothetical protein
MIIKIKYYSSPRRETTPYFDNRVSKRTESGELPTFFHAPRFVIYQDITA